MSDFFSHQVLGSEEVEGEEQLAPENSAFDGFGLAGKKFLELILLLFTATTDIFECFFDKWSPALYTKILRFDFTIFLIE